jgi:hypothetical protein
VLQAGGESALRVSVRNCSSHAWPSLPDAKGRYQVNLANHWLDEDGQTFARDDARCPLSQDLEPGARLDLMLGIRAPRFDGAYWLELDLVQENVCWFAQHGSGTLRIPCRVIGGLPPPQRVLRAAVAAGPVALFSARHPLIFPWIRATGLRDAYWSLRRGADGVKGWRDRLVWWLRDHAYERVVPVVVNWWKGRPFAARMDMHCVSRSEVLALVSAEGGRVVDVEEELMPGGFQSCRYWVTH